MTQRFIVTGGAGFIGSNLVRALNERGCRRILVVDHCNHAAKRRNLAGLQFEDYYDKTDFRALLREDRVPRVSGVFHLGACSSTTETDQAYLNDNNLRYSQELCQWSLRTGARFVYASSAATYGDGSHGYGDDHAGVPTLHPLNLYGWSKQQFDLWALKTGAMRQIAGVKYFNVYGPGEDHKGDMRSVVAKSYGQVLRRGTIHLFRSYRPEFRDGAQARDFVYVTDAVATTLFFYDHPDVSGVFNCGTGMARTWIDVAKAVFDAAGVPPAIEFIDMPEPLRHKYQYHTKADLAKLRAAGYTRPFVCIEEGIRRYVVDYLAPQASVSPDRPQGVPVAESTDRRVGLAELGAPYKSCRRSVDIPRARARAAPPDLPAP
jgi:ADP-L-glycero-D-manno-heptose 6-epimerase